MENKLNNLNGIPETINEQEKELAIMNKKIFLNQLTITIDAKLAELFKSKPADKQYLTFWDLLAVILPIKNIFTHCLGFVPAQIEVACKLAEAILAPSTREKASLLKKVFSLSGGLGGIAMIITGIGTALGWGAGVISAVIAFFIGTSILGPLGWIVGGTGLVVMSGYFAFKGEEAEVTERTILALKNGLDSAVDALWPEYGEQLEKAITVKKAA